MFQTGIRITTELLDLGTGAEALLGGLIPQSYDHQIMSVLPPNNTRFKASALTSGSPKIPRLRPTMWCCSKPSIPAIGMQRSHDADLQASAGLILGLARSSIKSEGAATNSAHHNRGNQRSRLAAHRDPAYFAQARPGKKETRLSKYCVAVPHHSAQI